MGLISFFLHILILFIVCTKKEFFNEIGSITTEVLDLAEVSNGFITVGYSLYGTYESQYAKYGSEGYLEYAKSVTGGKNYIRGIAIVESENMVFSGYTEIVGPGSYSCFITKLNPSGEIIWFKFFGGSKNDRCIPIIETPDGDLITSGYTYSRTPSDVADAFIVKLDSNGDILFSKYLDFGEAEKSIHSLNLYSDGYVLSGYTDSFPTGNSDVFIATYDFNLDLQWTQTIETNLAVNDYSFSMISTSDDAFAVLGYMNVASRIALIKIHPNGTLIFSKKYEGVSEDRGLCIIETKNGDFVIGGRSFSPIVQETGFLLRVDKDGDFLWATYYNDPLSTNSRVDRVIELENSDGLGIIGLTQIGGTSLSYFGVVDSTGRIEGTDLWEAWTTIVGSDEIYIIKDRTGDSSTGDLFWGSTEETGIIVIDRTVATPVNQLFYKCDDFWFGDDCLVTTCFNVSSNHTDTVCSGNGTCENHDFCNCSEFYHGENCEIYECAGFYSNETETEICNGNGNCSIPGGRSCDCDVLWFGEACDVFECAGFFSNESKSEICNGHGNCTVPGNTRCSCDSNYTFSIDDDCSAWYCFEIFNNDTENVCNGHGKCTDINICDCEEGYNGTECYDFGCWGIHFENKSTVCHGYGNCTFPDTCDCGFGYDTFENCGEWKCFNISNQDSEVCSGHGVCTGTDTCECVAGYDVDDCSHTKCGDFISTDSRVCSGHGVCVSVDNCVCDPQYFFNSSGIGCIHCPNGTHHDDLGAIGEHSCMICENGTFSTILDDLGCTICPKGSYSSAAREKCFDCPKGTYNDQKGMNSITDCVHCETGYYGPYEGVISRFGCVACPPGTYNPSIGSLSMDDCVSCEDGEECPLGSSDPFPLVGESVENLITYEDLGVNLLSDSVPFEFKMGILVFFLCFCCCFLFLICCCTIVFPRCIWEYCSCCDFISFDCCYDMKHRIQEGKGPIKRSTNLGGFFSIIAVCVAAVFLIWSVSDFVYGSKKISTSADFYQANETNQISGTLGFYVHFYGDFEQNNCSSTHSIDGFKITSDSFSCDQKYDGSIFLGCVCEYICHDCIVKKSDLYVKVEFPHYGEFVRFIRYELILPSFYDDEPYNVTGYFYENNGTIDSATIDLAIYPRVYETQSYWNLLFGILDLEEFGMDSYSGIGAGIVSMERNVVDHFSLEEKPGVVPFVFNMKVSNFCQMVREYFPQTLLNFIAQIFSLIGLSVSVVGIFFGRLECLKDCFCKRAYRFLLFEYCCVKGYKKGVKRRKKEEKRRREILFDDVQDMKYWVDVFEKMRDSITEKKMKGKKMEELFQVFVDGLSSSSNNNNSDISDDNDSLLNKEEELEDNNNNNNDSSDEAVSRYEKVTTKVITIGGDNNNNNKIEKKDFVELESSSGTEDNSSQTSQKESSGYEKSSDSDDDSSKESGDTEEYSDSDSDSDSKEDSINNNNNEDTDDSDKEQKIIKEEDFEERNENDEEIGFIQDISDPENQSSQSKEEEEVVFEKEDEEKEINELDLMVQKMEETENIEIEKEKEEDNMEDDEDDELDKMIKRVESKEIEKENET